MMKLKVELLAYTPNGEELIATAAKLCYSRSDIESLKEKQTVDAVESFIDKLISIGHETPLEHVSYTFGIEGVSRSLSHQLVRHRMASYSQQSQRYVKLDQFEYVIPPAIERNKEALTAYKKAMIDSQNKYDEIFEILFRDNYNALLDEGKDENTAKRQAEKKSLEDARYVFPNACETKIIATMNIRSLNNFFKQRTCLRAQWEIRELAMEMLKLVRKTSPLLFKDSGPSCISGRCSEGKMNCGKANEVREEFKKL